MTYSGLRSAIPFSPQPYVLAGLTDGHEYSVSMRARNAQGYATVWSPDSVLDLTVPVVDTAPRINSFVAAPTTIASTETTDLTVQAVDDENDTITFSYSIVTIDGTVTTSTNPNVIGSFGSLSSEVISDVTFGYVTWDPPSADGIYVIRVTATAQGMTVTRDVTVTIINPPSRPDAPVLTFPSASSLRVDWDAPDDNGGADIDEYQVRYRQIDNLAYTTLTFDSSPLPTQTDITTGIDSNNQYEAQVRARNESNDEWSEWSLHGRTPDPTPPSRPDAPTLSFLSSTSLRISWSAPSDNGGALIDEYQVRYRRRNIIFITIPFNFDPLPTQTDISGISSRNRYIAQVRAKNESNDEWSEWSEIGRTPPAPRPPIPDAPTVTSHTNNTQLNVSWMKPTDPTYDETIYPITDYNIRYRLSGSNQPYSNFLFSGAGTSTIIIDLIADREYDVQVQAGNNAFLYSDWSLDGTGETSTGPPPPPTNLLDTDVRSDRITIRWVAPSGATVTGYDIEYKERSEIEWTVWATDLDATTTTIMPLSADTPYNIRVASRNSAGIGNYTPTLNVRTLDVNVAPTITSLTISDSDIIVHEFTDLTVVANDANGDSISFNYRLVSVEGSTPASTDIGTFIVLSTSTSGNQVTQTVRYTPSVESAEGHLCFRCNCFRWHIDE